MTPADPKYGAIYDYYGAFVDTNQITEEYIQRGKVYKDYKMGFKIDASKGETKTDGTLKTATEHKAYGASNHVTPFNATIKVWQRIS